MKEITIGQAQKLTSPNPFALLGYTMPDGKTNLMAISWWSYASNHKPTLTVCLSQKGYAHERIHANNKFTLNIVSEAIKEEALRCGFVSGRICNKPEEFNISMVDLGWEHPMGVAESVVTFMCKAKEYHLVEDHELIVAEIIDILADNSKVPVHSMNGYAYLASLIK